ARPRTRDRAARGARRRHATGTRGRDGTGPTGARPVPPRRRTDRIGDGLGPARPPAKPPSTNAAYPSPLVCTASPRPATVIGQPADAAGARRRRTVLAGAAQCPPVAGPWLLACAAQCPPVAGP